MDQAEQLRKLTCVEGMPVKEYGARENKCRIVTVSAGKGGVGKTSIVVNMALALAQSGMRVGIFDADLGLSNVDIILGLSPKKNLSHVLLDGENLLDIVMEGPQKIKVIPASSGVEELVHLSDNLWHSLINQLALIYDEFDVFLVDTAAGIGKNVINFSLASQELILVVTPDPASMTDTYAMVKIIAGKSRSKIIHFLLNQVRDRGEAFEVYKKMEKLILSNLDVFPNFFGWIPEDRNLLKSVRARKGLVITEPESPASMAIYSLMKRWRENVPPYGNTGNIRIYLKRIRNLMQKLN